MKTGFRIGRVLSVGLRLWVRNLVPLVLQTALVHAPVIAWGCVVAAGAPDRQQYYAIVSFEMLLYTPMLAVNALASGMVAPGVIKELQGQRLAFRARLTRGLARAPAAFGTLLLGVLYLAVVYLGITFPLTLVGIPAAGAICGTLSALYFLVRFYVAIPASVIERPGVYEALARSGDLTGGHRIMIAGMLLLLIVGSLVLGGIVLAVVGAIGPLSHRESVPDLRPWLYIELGRSLLVGSVMAVLPTVTYYFLRAEKQGVSADELGVIFE